MRKVIPYIKPEYFDVNIDKELFITIKKYVDKYNYPPSKEALEIDILDSALNDEQLKTCQEFIAGIVPDQATSLEWLINRTEQFCKDKELYIALTKSIQICENPDTKLNRESIPQILSEALAISFDTHIGHDYFEGAEERYEDYYHLQEHKIPFRIQALNKITKGGISRKSLTIIMAPPHCGKTAIMCGLAADHLSEGRNVLYITLEMSEMMIMERIEANLMDLEMDRIRLLDKESFLFRVNCVKERTAGKLIVKEYPTSQAGAANFRYLLNELRLKKNFVPDIIYLDYLNICISSRLKSGKASLYEYVKSISEEIRGLTTEFDLALITATQINREGSKSTDPGMDTVAESWGVNFTGDLILAAYRNEEMDRQKQLMLIQLKNRFSNISDNKRFLIGMDFSRMRLYNIGDENEDSKENKPESFYSQNEEFGFSKDDF